VIVGAFGVQLGMLFSPDAYYFALLPVIRNVAAAAGVPLDAVARAMLIERTPVSPSALLYPGLSGTCTGSG
jgi:CitMHS family citrate-Mg2+:H+ or citrate-Ca2+:H+ symporter